MSLSVPIADKWRALHCTLHPPTLYTTPPYTLHHTPYTLHYSPQFTHSTLTHSTLIFGATCRPWGHLRTPLVLWPRCAQCERTLLPTRRTATHENNLLPLEIFLLDIHLLLPMRIMILQPSTSSRSRCCSTVKWRWLLLVDLPPSLLEVGYFYTWLLLYSSTVLVPFCSPTI